MRPLHHDAVGILSAAFPHPLLSRWDDPVVDVNTMPLVARAACSPRSDS